MTLIQMSQEISQGDFITELFYDFSQFYDGPNPKYASSICEEIYKLSKADWKKLQSIVYQES